MSVEGQVEAVAGGLGSQGPAPSQASWGVKQVLEERDISLSSSEIKDIASGPNSCLSVQDNPVLHRGQPCTLPFMILLTNRDTGAHYHWRPGSLTGGY